MRTTLDIDDALLASVQARFPAGTPITVLVEGALRRLLAPGPSPSAARDPRLQRMIDAGHVAPAIARGPYPRAVPTRPVAFDQLMADLAGDREDR